MFRHRELINSCPLCIEVTGSWDVDSRPWRLACGHFPQEQTRSALASQKRESTWQYRLWLVRKQWVSQPWCSGYWHHVLLWADTNVWCLHYFWMKCIKPIQPIKNKWVVHCVGTLNGTYVTSCVFEFLTGIWIQEVWKRKVSPVLN
jgi:hypothetical protein